MGIRGCGRVNTGLGIPSPSRMRGSSASTTQSFDPSVSSRPSSLYSKAPLTYNPHHSQYKLAQSNQNARSSPILPKSSLLRISARVFPTKTFPKRRILTQLKLPQPLPSLQLPHRHTHRIVKTGSWSSIPCSQGGMASDMTVPTMENYGWEGLSEALMRIKGYTWLYEMRVFGWSKEGRQSGQGRGEGGGPRDCDIHLTRRKGESKVHSEVRSVNSHKSS